MTENRLRHESSPYLLQHADNPVHWQAWNDDTLALARREDKPILLSVGYAACHWCHVMAHESFEDPDIAAVMNELFVNIKVDREERPDLDTIYQTALALTGQQGGWPLTMFLTPAGEPFWGGTYFPAAAKYGRPAFPDVLRSVAETYRAQPDRVAQNVTILRDALSRLAQSPGNGGLGMDVVDAAADAALQTTDPTYGGTLGAPKFPQVALFRFLWRAYRRRRADAFRQVVTLSLDAMSQGGIYDHLGGGFARYATDQAWLVPHFEKMLYDNAQLVELLTEVWQDDRNPLYAARVAETVAWVLRDMTVAPDDGGEDGAGFAFAAAFDADSEGKEGRYYVWSADEIDALLGAEAALFKDHYDVTAGGNWEGATILNRSARPQLQAPAVEEALAAARARLLEARARRVPPLRDGKVLADWNGMMIAALAEAGAAFGRDDWIDAARTAFAFVTGRMAVDGRLRHSWCAGRARHAAVLDDYAQMGRAALHLFEVTADPLFLAQAEAWAAVVDRHYRDGAGGGYYVSADDTTDTIVRSKSITDNATPSANGVMLEVLVRLHLLTGNPDYAERAEALVRALGSDDIDRLSLMPSLMAAYELYDGPVQVVVVGTPGADDTRRLLRAVFEAPLPNRVLLQAAPGAPLPDGHPAAGKTAVDGRATAYVCVNRACGLPVTDPEALSRELLAL